MFTIFNGYLMCQGSINKRDAKFTNFRMFICYIEKNILSDYFHKMLITLYYIINLIVIEYTSCHVVFNLFYTCHQINSKLHDIRPNLQEEEISMAAETRINIVFIQLKFVFFLEKNWHEHCL